MMLTACLALAAVGILATLAIEAYATRPDDTRREALRELIERGNCCDCGDPADVICDECLERRR